MLITYNGASCTGSGESSGSSNANKITHESRVTNSHVHNNRFRLGGPTAEAAIVVGDTTTAEMLAIL